MTLLRAGPAPADPARARSLPRRRTVPDMRLFAALLPPDAAVTALAEAVDPLHRLPGADRLRWTSRASWHITLAFYGEVDGDGVLDPLRERLARAAGRSRPMDLRVAGAGRFGGRALWAGIEGDRDALRRLAQAARAAGRRSGLDMAEGRAFRPHLTVARTRGRTASTDLRPYVEALGAFHGETWTATELALVHSRLPTSGVPGEQPHYTTIATWTLGG